MVNFKKIFFKKNKIIIFKKFNIFIICIYNSFFKCFINLPKNYFTKIFINKKLHFIKIFNKNFNKNKILLKNYSYLLNIFTKQLNFYNHIKIIIKGKGYKLQKLKNNILKLILNKSHFTIFTWKNNLIKKLKKRKLLFKVNTVIKKQIIKQDILKKRYLNIFTMRGLKTTRGIFLKKKSKK